MAQPVAKTAAAASTMTDAGKSGGRTGFGGGVGDERFMRKGGRSMGPRGSFSYHVTARSTKLTPASIGVALVASLALGACTTDVPPPRPPARPPVTAAAPPPAPRFVPADGSYYESVEANVRVVLAPSDLPLTDEQIARPDGADARWTQSPEPLRERVRRNGFAVLTGAGHTRLGEHYQALHAARVPFVITMDALLQIAHFALDRMLAEAEARTMTPALGRLLARLGTRLDAESVKVTTDLAVAYDTARGLVGVARAFAEPGYVPPKDIADDVGADVRAAVTASPAAFTSATLGLAFEPSFLAPRGAALGDFPLGSYRAAAWLGAAPLVIASRAQPENGVGDVYEARSRTRAALLIARLLLPDVDPVATEAYDALSRPLALVRGPSDDLSPRDLLAVAQAAKVDVRTVEAIQNVRRVDIVRRLAAASRASRIVDGPRASQVRLLGAAATADADVLQALVQPALASRTMPSGLDVAMWLGASEARTIVREIEPDEPEGYDAAVAALLQRRPPEVARHGSLAWTGLDALSAYLGASTADGAVPASSTWAWRRRKVEVALGGWTTLRHDVVPFTHAAVRPATPAPAPAARATPVLGFVEPHPDAIARLVALVEQAARGLVAVGAIERPAPGSVPVMALDLLRTSLAVSLREANDEPLEPEQAQAVSEMPARIADMEARLGPTAAVDRALVIDVHEDRTAGRRVLEEATGRIDDLYVVLREPRTGRLVLAVGASLAHHELVEAGLPLTDDAWRARLAAHPPLRAPWTAAYVVGPVAN
jgi:hypothetical protein